MFELLAFQKQAQEKLFDVFLQAWNHGSRNTPIVLKAPTGSGKTLITCSFINGLNSLPNWDQDKAYVWVTFHEDLAMQSKTKFAEYFANNLENQLLTVNDLNRGKLFKNDILFLNWEKVKAKKAENRVILRPEDPLMRKEAGFYFEDFIENTHKDGREIILIIDEAHSHVNTDLAQKVIAKINPNTTLHISATPSQEIELEAYRHNSMVEVLRSDVIKEGLIKEQIITQTEDDLMAAGSADLDEALLELGVQKYEELRTEYEELEKNINPLVLIQLPNDDSRLVDLGHPTKETITVDYLKKKGYQDHQIALWFDGRKVNYDETIKNNRSEVNFLLFKQAAGTGWDCPRAHVLVMFREISSATFYIQTLGRILRMAEPGKLDDYLGHPNMTTGYLYTNFKRDELREQDDYKKNNVRDVLVNRRDEIENISLTSDFKQRVDYGDLGSAAKFQMSFIKSMDNWLGLENGILGAGKAKLLSKNIDLDPKITYEIITDAQFKDFDQISIDFRNSGEDFSVEMSKSDVEKAFNLACYDFLAEQTETETKIGNLARSWSPFKSSIRVWLKSILPEAENNPDHLYRVVINDLTKGSNSILAPMFTNAIKSYFPIRQEILKQREESSSPRYEFKILEQYAYTDEYEEIPQKKCALDRCMLRKDYLGRKNEEAFINHLEGMSSVDWWFKNHDYGKEHYAIKYLTHSTNEWKLFYPDWIVRFTDGRVGIYDTKSGRTAEDTDGRAESLSEKLTELGNGFTGGIAVKENGAWYVNHSKDYSYVPGNLGADWKILN